MNSHLRLLAITSQPIFHRSSLHSRAIVYREYGDPMKVLKIEELEVKAPKSDEVLLKFLAAPINPADLNTVEGTYGVKPQFPAVAGGEGVAEILEVGTSIKSLKVGDHVLPRRPMLGTWQTHAIFPAENVIPVSKDLPHILAATLSVNPCTAYRMLHDFVSLQPGDVVVQNGSTSVVGHFVMQLARKMGVHTVNLIRARATPEATDKVKQTLRENGGTFVFTEDELRGSEAKNVLSQLKGSRVPLALNCVGGKAVLNLLRFLSPKGTLVTYGGMSRQPMVVPVGPLIFQDVQLKGFWMTAFYANPENADERLKMYNLMTQYLLKKEIVPPQYTPVPFSSFMDALQHSRNSDSSPETLKSKQVLIFSE